MRWLFLTGFLLSQSFSRAGTIPLDFMEPSVGSEQTVTAGSDIFTRGKGVPSVVLLEDVAIGNIFNSARFPAGSQLAIDPIQTGGSTMVACGVGDLGGVCLVDKGIDGTFDKHRPSTGLLAYKLKVPVRYKWGPPIPTTGTASSYRQTLSFLGVNGQTLRLAYREYVNEMARPAFTDEVTFSLSGTYPETVAYRDLVIEVLGIGNTGLRYRLVKADAAPQ